MSFNHEVDRANVLAEALPYIQKYYGKTVVVKYGGNAMISEGLRHAVISDIILLHLVGIRVVVVHGGGPEISGMLKKIGKESKFVDGLRYTDDETMDIVQQILCGKVNKDLVATLNRTGGKALGLCGMDGGLFEAKMLDDGKYGQVGEIVNVNAGVVEDALANGYIPVVSTVAQGLLRTRNGLHMIESITVLRSHLKLSAYIKLPCMLLWMAICGQTLLITNTSSISEKMQQVRSSNMRKRIPPKQSMSRIGIPLSARSRR